MARDTVVPSLSVLGVTVGLIVLIAGEAGYGLGLVIGGGAIALLAVAILTAYVLRL